MLVMIMLSLNVASVYRRIFVHKTKAGSNETDLRHKLKRKRRRERWGSAGQGDVVL